MDFRTFRGAETLAGTVKVVAQINQHIIKNQQPTFKSIELKVLVIVDYIDISWIQPLYEKDCYHIPVQMIIELKHFLCNIWIKNFVIFEKMEFWYF